VVPASSAVAAEQEHLKQIPSQPQDERRILAGHLIDDQTKIPIHFHFHNPSTLSPSAAASPAVSSSTPAAAAAVSGTPVPSQAQSSEDVQAATNSFSNFLAFPSASAALPTASSGTLSKGRSAPTRINSFRVFIRIIL
jgi:hypothetical protein